ncbi:MAG: flagellar basal body P-ring formation chaperone FlgA [Chitinispirillales bacterium]|jgi:flagella basal body P-ring formation protein FlgA|nr:flagellar basal body P-ring formation chaperone FlgA [Chitinispirillales bacterium]
MKSAAVILFSTAILLAKTQVILLDSSAVETEFIRLGQVSQIIGEHKVLLDTLSITTSAPPGFSRFLLKSNIIIPAEIKNTTTIIGADRIKIHSLSQKIPYEDLAQAAKKLLENFLVNTETVKSEVLFEFAKGAELNVALGDYEVVLGKIDVKQLRGRTVIPLVVVQKNGEKKTRITLNALIKIVAKVCVASKDMARYEKFAPQNLEYKTVDISTLNGTPLYEMPKIDEYQIIGAIRSGTIITDKHIAPRHIVESGSPVKMVSGGSMVKVYVWGRARSSGRIGDIIAVENMESNKIVRGKIIQPGEVEIIR